MFGDMGGLEGEIFRKAAANGGETSFNMADLDQKSK
jgi:hypothetical protein